MAVVSTKEKSTLKLQYSAGIDENGKPILKTFSISNIKADLEDEALFNLNTAIATIQEFAVSEVKRVDETVISA